MLANYLKEGSHNVICDRCGQKYKREQIKKEWQGQLTCYNCWDPRHPWTLPQPVSVDGLPIPDARPRPTARNVFSDGFSTWDNILSLPTASDLFSLLAVFLEFDVRTSWSTTTDLWFEDIQLWRDGGYGVGGYTINWENADIYWEET